MTLFDVVVFVPTLVSRAARFRVSGRPPAEGLYVTADELHEDLANCKDWPPAARILSDRVFLGVSFPDGETRVDSRRHEVCHGVKLAFTLEAPGVPPPRAWPHRWAVKSIIPHYPEEAA